MSLEIQITETQTYKYREDKSYYRNAIIRNTEIKTTGLQKYKLHIYQYASDVIQIFFFLMYRIINYRNTEVHIAEIQITNVQKFKLQKCCNSIYRITIIQEFKYIFFYG